MNQELDRTTVTLTDQSGARLGLMDKLQAHQSPGTLHLAFSAYIFNLDKSQILIQQRCHDKLLFAGIWANSCCSHPCDGEPTVDAGQRRVKEELGFACQLRAVSSIVYQAEDPAGNGAEHEYVTLLFGTVDHDIAVSPLPTEVADWKWINLKTLQAEMRDDPDRFSPWFHQGLPEVLRCIGD